jgi:hypothetical protein
VNPNDLRSCIWNATRSINALPLGDSFWGYCYSKIILQNIQMLHLYLFWQLDITSPVINHVITPNYNKKQLFYFQQDLCIFTNIRTNTFRLKKFSLHSTAHCSLHVYYFVYTIINRIVHASVQSSVPWSSMVVANLYGALTMIETNCSISLSGWGPSPTKNQNETLNLHLPISHKKFQYKGTSCYNTQPTKLD